MSESSRQLAHAQQHIWTGQQLHPDAPLYNMVLSFTITGQLDTQRFAQSFAHVVAATDAMRTTFSRSDDGAIRTVQPEIDFVLPVIDCGEGPAALERARSLVEQSAMAPIDISTQCFDSALLRCGDDTHVWFLNQHHLIGDAWSFTLTYERITECYLALEAGDDLSTEPYPSFQLLVDHALADNDSRQQAIEYWDEWLQNPAPRSNLYGRVHIESSTQSTRVRREFGHERSEQLQQLMERRDIRSISRELTMFTVLGAVLSSWIARTSGQTNVGLGFLGHNRASREFKEIAGTFVELFPLANEVDPTDSFETLIKRTAGQAMQSLRRVGNGVSQPRLTADLNVIFNLITATLPAFGTRTVRSEWVHNGHCDAAHDVRAQFHDYDGSGNLVAIFDFKDALFNEQQRGFAVDHFFRLLDACLDDPAQLVAAPSLAGVEEHELLVARGQARSTAQPILQQPVVRQIEQVAREHPERIACTSDGRTLTYQELDLAANELAHRLLTTDDANGGVVALLLDRSVDFVVAAVAAHKAGAAYLPIDPRDPVDRLAALIDTSGACVVVVDREPQGHDLAVPVIEVRAEAKATALEAPPIEISPEQRAYLIGTSGSTGIPKVIQVEHRNLSALIGGLSKVVYDQHAVANDGAPLNVGVVAPFGFDPSVQQIFAGLALGHSVHIVSHDVRVDGAKLFEFLEQHDIDVCDGTPAHLRMLLDGSPHDIARLDTHFLIGGDVLPKSLARRFLERGADANIKLTNLYGPAECCVDTTWWDVELDQLDDHHTVPIGRPLPGVRVAVVDDQGRSQPFGVVGELCISGSGVGRGYLADPDLTAAKFEDDPVHGDQRRYRTGDLARMNASGALEFVERTDSMVKVQGYRIELAEVENALKSYRTKRRMIPLRPAEPERCTRCLLSERHVGIDLVDGICSTCRLFDDSDEELATYFGDVDDFSASVNAATRAGADYDCMLLYSGGKDSSYVLYRLAALGLRVLAFTFDNGHISDAAFANIKRQTSRLNIDSVVMTADHMDEIFLQSLNEESTVCDGCFRALTAISSKLAIDKGIATVVTGLSRGQIFDTKLGPLLAQGVTNPAEIEDKLRVFRSGYHSRQDRTSTLLDIDLDILTLESMNFVDWFRYDASSTAEVLAYLQAEDSYWSQPEDTGFCSTNCRMNDVGIAVHSATQGFHNYEQPLSWDIRLGLLDRSKGLLEVQPPEDKAYVEKVLDDIGYLVREVTDAAVKVVEDDSGARQLHAFYVANQALTVDELRSGLGRIVPKYMIPARFFRVDEIPLTPNGKVDRDALHADADRPELETSFAAPRNPLETSLAEIWTGILGVDKIGIHDSFFALGGDSIMALEVVTRAQERGLMITPMQVFSAATIAGIVDVVSSDDDHVGAAPGQPRPAPTRRNTGGAPELTLAEQSLLLEQSLRPDDKMFNVTAVYRVAGPVDAGRFEAAIHQVVQHHEPLRWTFDANRTELAVEHAVQCVVEPTRTDGPQVEQALADMQMLPFDLQAGPLLRAMVQPLDSGHTVVSLNLHHISIDHGGLDILWEAIAAVYAGSEQHVPEIGYADLEHWQSQDWDRDQAFWASQPFGAELRLPADHHESDGYVEIASSVSGSELRAASGRTVFATAMTAAAAASRPLFASDDVEVSLVASTRNHALARPLIGYLLNPLPLQVEVSSARTFAGLADEVSAATASALVHRSYPYVRMVEDARRAGRSAPGGQVFVAISDEPTLDLDGVAVQQAVRFNGSAVTDLTLFVVLRGEDVTVGAEYSGRLGRAAAQMTLSLFEQAITSVLRSPDATLASGQIDSAQASVLIGASLPESLPLAVDAIVGTPAGSHTAIEVGDVNLSWADMIERAVAVAGHLHASGLIKGERVVVRTGRSVHLPVAMLGVLIAGGSYVPMAATTTVERVRENGEAVGAAREIVAPGVSRALSSTLIIDDVSFAGSSWQSLTSQFALPAELPGADDEAYVIFTSGSTGQANPVAITHGQLAASTGSRAQVYDRPPTRFAVLSGPGFDSSLVGLFWTLMHGGTVVMPTEMMSQDVDELASLLATGSFSHSLCVPTLYGLLLSRRPDAGWPEHMIVAGEACTAALVDEHFLQVPSSQLTNEYGPTEATIWASAHQCMPGQGAPPIGTPVPGMWLAVVDHAKRVVPAGVVGELVIGAPTVAQGYVGQDQHWRFGDGAAITGLPAGLPSSNDRVFATGDRAVVRDGTVHFLGRTDDQINIGGVRVEPGEIEAALARIDGVDAAAVVAVDVRTIDEMMAQASSEELSTAMSQAAGASDPAAGLRTALQAVGEHDVRLVAHLAGADDLDVGSVRSQAAELLGPLRQPKLYAVHHDLPRTTNGKVDRRAAAALPLPAAVESAASGSHVLTGWTARVHQLFCDVLRAPAVDLDASFFDQGGDSLQALKLLTMLQERHGIDLPAAAVHNAPTVNLLAARASASENGANATTAATGSLDQLVDDEELLAVTLQPGGDATPIVALHVIGPGGDMWRPLVDELDDQHPFHCLADVRAVINPWQEDEAIGRRAIDETATRYANAIRNIVPDGPVILLGLCQGGVLAFETAHQLKPFGVDVENVIIVHDAHAPGVEAFESFRGTLQTQKQISGQRWVPYIVGALRRGRYTRTLRYFAESVVYRAATAVGLPAGRFIRNIEEVEGSIAELKEYEFRYYDGSVKIVRSSLAEASGAGDWSRVVADLDVALVDGHGTGLVETSVIDTARAIARWLGAPTAD